MAGHNDPENLTIDSDGLAVLVCDFCEESFTREVNRARRELRRNKGGFIYCSKTCSARAANKARPRRRRRPAETNVCHIRPDAAECPLLAAPPLHTGDLRRSEFKPETETELDLCIEFVRASAELRDNAPPADADTPWNPEKRIAWERADATHEVVSRLLEREVTRRKR